MNSTVISNTIVMKQSVLMFGFLLTVSFWTLAGVVHVQATQDITNTGNASPTDDSGEDQISYWDEIVWETQAKEREGAAVWQRFLAQEISCDEATQEQFGVLGEYFMGEMVGEDHAAMNAMLMQMHGVKGEEEIHTTLGKRLSGCDPSAVFATGYGGWLPSISAMNGAGMMNVSDQCLGCTHCSQSINSTLPRWDRDGSVMHGVARHRFYEMILSLGSFIFLGGIIYILWQMQSQKKAPGLDDRALHSPLEILRERYARGEIEKEEFEQKRKDIGSS